MPHIKKLILKGFKSFAKETEIEFSNSMNVIVGPNGSGKTNIIDSLCFVLGRLSIKSIRATKSANLIFAGTKEHKPANEASVKLILDNSDKKFPLPEKEITIERIVRKKGQSIYKINSEIKTRQEVLEVLATAGIDPYGFNIILQGEIDSFVKMSGEERREIIEEVAGISIYETRKEKSLRELEKTDEKLKEVSTTLRERTAYLKNLEIERKQALRFKKLQELERRYKASIIKKKLDEKLLNLNNLKKHQLEEEETRKNFVKQQEKILNVTENFQKEIDKINFLIQKSSGIEQTELQNKISDLRAELAGLDVQKTNSESRIEELASRKTKIEQDIKIMQENLEKLRKEFPSQDSRLKELEKKKFKLGEIEKQRKTFYNLKSQDNTLKERIFDKEKDLEKANNESNFLLREIENIAENLTFKELESAEKELNKSQDELKASLRNLEEKEEKRKQQEKIIIQATTEIANYERIKKQVSSLDICPLCKSKITPSHIKEVYKECDEKILFSQKRIQELDKNIEDEIKKLTEYISILQNSIRKTEINLVKIENIESKKEQIKRLGRGQESLRQEISNLTKEKISLEKKLQEYKDIEETYDKLFFEIQEISSISKENLDSELAYKERELERTRLLIKQSDREEESITQELEEIKSLIEEKEHKLEEKEKEEQEIEKKYHKLLEKKTEIEKEIHKQNIALFEARNNISNTENKINNLKIELARIDAEKQNLEIDFSAYQGIETINLPVYILEEKLNQAKIALQSIGSVNLRALEVYDKVKEDYEEISEKASIIEKEKLEILKIIEEIDKKKRRTFVRTLNDINNLFNRNFSQLYTKGSAYLELENLNEPFSAGLDIIIKTGKGKYFDVTSLSGGEQTLIALSLIFAIQEYKPYSFYIFDEVDAALDKRNSERLAMLIKRYMKTGQYIIITHNDAIITESTILYGVSMQEGISKIISLEV